MARSRIIPTAKTSSAPTPPRVFAKLPHDWSSMTDEQKQAFTDELADRIVSAHTKERPSHG
jgi:hypothetical protein